MLWLALVVGVHFFGMSTEFHTSIYQCVRAAKYLLVLLLFCPGGTD
ncbi:MAG TPA: hypothetical protein VE641_20910 [Chthoniobacterales bacterium]|jgi:hypothetical protein|nr:hypothetical protein [Chthoniobacterales bacterium]